MSTITATPIQPSERTIIVDVLRGFALFGVLLTNLWGLETEIPESLLPAINSSLADKVTDATVSVLFLNKFITLFSLLFGYGFGVILERTTGKGFHPVPFFLRRMSILFIAGMIHIGFWWGEVLSIYALCGVLLLLFRNANTKSLFFAGFLLLLVGGPAVQFLRFHYLAPDPQNRELVFQSYFEAIRHGSLTKVYTANYSLMKFLFMDSWLNYRDTLEILGKFLLGYYFLKKGFLKDLSRYAHLIKKTWQITMVIGFLYVAEKTILYLGLWELKNKNLKLLEYLFNNIGTLSLSLFYACSLILAYRKMSSGKIFEWLRQVGTLSLTNYITHTFFYVILFSGLGFGLLGQMSLYLIVPLTLLIFSAQILFSRFWMKRFLYGPFEWIWRQLTYRKRLPIRRTS